MAVGFRNHPPPQVVLLDGFRQAIGHRYNAHERSAVFDRKPARYRRRTPDRRLDGSLAHERVVESRLLEDGSHAHLPHERGIEVALRLYVKILLEDIAMLVQLLGLRLFRE